MSELFGRLAAWSVRRRGAAVAAAAFLALLGAIGAFRLTTDTGTSTLVDHGSDTYAETQQFNKDFGDEPVRILVSGDQDKGGLRNLVLTKNLGTLLRLEGCLSGRVPKGQQPAAGICTQIAALNPSKVVFGPATFLNQAAIQAQQFLGTELQATQQQARAAGQQAQAQAVKQGATPAQQQQAAQSAAQGVLQQFQAGLLQLSARYGQTGMPRLDDPKFVESVVFDSRFTGGVPKTRFAALFPSSNAALITIRLRPDLSEAERRRAVDLFRGAVDDPTFSLDGASYVVGGDPVVATDLSERLDANVSEGFGSEVFTLLAAALALMAATLAVVLRPPLRLLPLAVAIVAVSVVFGSLGLVGGTLTMASLAALPILIGLGVDYAIQFHARFREALGEGTSRAEAAVLAATRGGPVIATAVLATAAGFLVWLLPPISPIPMVRSFALLVVLGVLIAFAVSLTIGFAALTLAGRGGGGQRRAGRPSGRSRQAQWLERPEAVRARGAVARTGMRLSAARHRIAGALGAAGRGAVALAIRGPLRVLSVAVLLAVLGWAAGTQTGLVSDATKLLPGDLPGLEASDDIQRETGGTGELNVLVRAPDVTDPKVIAWMGELKQRVLAQEGFDPEARSCENAKLCPGIALPDLFGGQGTPTRRRVSSVLSAIPPYFSQALLAPRGKGGATGSAVANLAFGIQVTSLDDQEQLVKDIRSQIDPPGTANDPPPGVEATVVGSRALTADALSSLESSRYWLPLASLLAVAAVLFATYRSAGRSLVPLIPIVLATGWAALVLAATRIDLDPMSATLSALVIAIATEFSVILSARYHEERAAGRSVGEALRRTYARTGAAVAASGITALAGFAVLALSGVPMLRNFGALTVLDLAVALLGVMLVLPAALVWAEGGFEPLPAIAARLGRSRRGARAGRLARRRAAGGARDAA
jgi:hydrophobe/amphiphile efflux-3 (HAE3) family protein